MSDEDVAMFGAFITLFIMLTIMFTIKLGLLIGICIGFASAVVIGVLGIIIFEEMTR